MFMGFNLSLDKGAHIFEGTGNYEKYIEGAF